MTSHARLPFASALLLAATMFSPMVGAQDPAKLDDLEIAHVAYTADSIDIRYAHLALALSQNPAVREFAETMIRDHSAFNEQALALAKKLNISPKENAVSNDLMQKSEALVEEMRKLDGAAFDKRYADNELSYHQFVNGAVEKIFIPNTKNDELKALLTSAFDVFKGHEKHAEQMVKSLQ